MKFKNEVLDFINNAIGTEKYYNYSPFGSKLLLTDGVYTIANAIDCFWLIDLIASHQGNNKLDRDFQVWILTVNEKRRSAVVCGYNDCGNGEKPIITQKISCTDFPLEELKLYLCNEVLILPHEY